jgi:GNAT superfamily N-acetyltransferase
MAVPASVVPGNAMPNPPAELAQMPAHAPSSSWRLRPPRPGDIGWVIGMHGRLYAERYGWDATFEGFVAEIAGGFVKAHDPAAERVWIAELDGRPVGSIFCMKKDDATARLRMLIVDPAAEGLGIGAALVDACIAFARQAGYRHMTLWTNDILVEALRLYQRRGFQLTSEEWHRSFGHDLVGQTWDLDL